MDGDAGGGDPDTRRRSRCRRPASSEAAGRSGTRVRQSVLYSDRPRRSRGRRGQSSPTKSRAEEDASGSEICSTTAHMSEEKSELEEDLPTFDSFADMFAYLRASNRAEMIAQGYDVSDEDVVMSEEYFLDKYEAETLVEPEQAPSVPAQGGYTEASTEEIAQNGKKWMCEEAMVAFKKYVETRDDLKGHDYQFSELLHQCFHVENYFKIFHHFNFTVKMKAPRSTEWTSLLCFAELKEILRQKIYFCSPLEPNENGECHACKNRRMDDLRHPIIGEFDRGDPFNICLEYTSDSDYDEYL